MTALLGDRLNFFYPQHAMGSCLVDGGLALCLPDSKKNCFDGDGSPSMNQSDHNGVSYRPAI